MASKQQIFISHSSGSWKSKIEVTADAVFGGAIPGSQVAVLLLGPHMAEGPWKLSGVPFIRALIPFVRALSSRPNHLPKAPLPNAITMGLRTSSI